MPCVDAFVIKHARFTNTWIPDVLSQLFTSRLSVCSGVYRIIISFHYIQLWSPHLCLCVQGWNTLQEREQITRRSLTLLLVNLPSLLWKMHPLFCLKISLPITVVLNCFSLTHRCLEDCHRGVGHWGLEWGCECLEVKPKVESDLITVSLATESPF